jgi:hypothetical protein
MRMGDDKKFQWLTMNISLDSYIAHKIFHIDCIGTVLMHWLKQHTIWNYANLHPKYQKNPGAKFIELNR